MNKEQVLQKCQGREDIVVVQTNDLLVDYVNVFETTDASALVWVTDSDIFIDNRRNSFLLPVLKRYNWKWLSPNVLIISKTKEILGYFNEVEEEFQKVDTTDHPATNTGRESNLVDGSGDVVVQSDQDPENVNRSECGSEPTPEANEANVE